MVAKLYLLIFVLFFSLSCTTIATDAPQPAAQPVQPFNYLAKISSPVFDRLDDAPGFIKPVENSFSLNFGPQLLKVKASYLEKREQISSGAVDGPQDANLRRYVNVLGSTSFGGSGLIGEGELTYSPHGSLAHDCACPDWPRTMRVGIRTRWQGFSYGADFRSVEKGFVPITEAIPAQARDEGQIWGEYNLGPLNIRGSVGESWEELIDANQMRITKGAGTTVRLNRSAWGGTLVSSYGLVEQGMRLSQEMTVLTHTLSGFYRPFNALSFVPSFGIREERDTGTGFRTETPRTEFSFVYTPYKDRFRLMAGTSYARTFSNYGLNEVATLGTRAGVDWKLGRFLGRDDTLSFNVNYNRQRDLISPANSHDDLTGILQLKITGF